MAPCLFEQKETKLCRISYQKLSLGGFTLLDSRLETRQIYRYLSNKPGEGGGGGLNLSSQCLLFNARYKKSKGTQYYFKPSQ